MLMKFFAAQTSRNLMRNSVRLFGAKQATVPEPLTVKQLHDMGRENGLQEVIVNYADACGALNGITNKQDSFTSFERQINANFSIQATEPVDILSRRVGLLGFKVGMTQFWDRWGCHNPCTVIQFDRCQVV